MKVIEEAVQRKCAQLKNRLLSDNSKMSYEKRWSSLQPFREQVSIYVNGYDELNTNELSSKVSVLNNGHLIDHHALGHFCPMSIKRAGFTSNGETCLRTPVEQLLYVKNFFENNGVRFIYVPLPCKTALYPTIIAKDDVIPDDDMVIPQWRKMLSDLLDGEMEVIDCYDELKHDKMSFTKNHHISPVGSAIIGKSISEYIRFTTENLNTYKNIITKIDMIGSPVLTRSGDNNSIELDVDFYRAPKVLCKDGSEIKPYIGKSEKTEIAVIGDCNLQSYRGTGFDITAQISGDLNYPIRYLGRYLPFAKNDSIDKLPCSSLDGIRNLIYVGFVSACFVRAPHEDDCWTTKLPQLDVFGR